MLGIIAVLLICIQVGILLVSFTRDQHVISINIEDISTKLLIWRVKIILT
jgi:hypothetical protein